MTKKPGNESELELASGRQTSAISVLASGYCIQGVPSLGLYLASWPATWGVLLRRAFRPQGYPFRYNKGQLCINVGAVWSNMT